ncbi:MAG: hypothetical protein JNJ57_10530 [Saprospiraceae bacterium]|nr:hypothetical protein [Saprospiraceae bacterium]
MKNQFVAPIAFVLLFVVANQAVAQKYKTAAGVRFDRGFNLTIQQYIKNGWTAEGILHTPLIGNYMGATVMAEKHHKILFRGINFYTGFGGHYYWEKDIDRTTAEGPAQNVAGLTGIAGLEFTVGRLNLSVDWKPELHLAGTSDKSFSWNGAAVSARYIIEKRERRKVKDWKVWDRFGKNKK